VGEPATAVLNGSSPVLANGSPSIPPVTKIFPVGRTDAPKANLRARIDGPEVHEPVPGSHHSVVALGPSSSPTPPMRRTPPFESNALP
jgi:hypothetical protein